MGALYCYEKEWLLTVENGRIHEQEQSGLKVCSLSEGERVPLNDGYGRR